MLPIYLSGVKLHHFIKSALEEDIGDGDFSSLSCIHPEIVSYFRLIAKSEGIIAGVELAERILYFVDKTLEISPKIKDGAYVEKFQDILYVKGSVLSILKSERLLLNCMQRMSGIATYTHYLKSLIQRKTPQVQLLDTRKTTPNFRLIEKWAVKIGGGENHRIGLFDMIMIKDNHIDIIGSISKAILKTNDFLKRKQLKLKIEVETRTLQEVKEVLQIGNIHRILLDNMSINTLKKAVQIINRRYETEASGKIDEGNIDQIAACGVDYISVGALTHSVKSMDISLIKIIA